MAKKVVHSFRGLLSNPNQLDLPEGALLEADNVSLLRPGVLRPRKGVNAHSVINAVSATVHRMWEWDGQRYAHWDDGGGTFDISRFIGSTWLPLPGVYQHPGGNAYKLRTAELNGALYVTEIAGLRRMVTHGSLPLAGVPKCLGIDPTGTTLTTDAAGVLPKEKQRAYCSTVVRKDAVGGVEVEGPPSGRFVARNTSTTNSVRPSLQVRLPRHANTGSTALTTDYWVRLYASETQPLDTEPSDDMALIYEAQLTGANIAAGYVNISDVTPDVLRGSALYTNSTQQGATQANEPPPFAKTLCNYKGALLLGHVAGRARLELQLLAVGGASGVQSGDVFHLDDLAGSTFSVTARTSPTLSTEYALETAGTLSASQQIALTAQNLVAAINRHPSNTFCTATYLGNPSDPRSIGLIVLEARVAGFDGGPATGVGAYVGTGSKSDCWEPSLPDGLGSVLGASEGGPNAWALSKSGIGDAFPVLQNGRCGVGSIIHVAALDDAAFLFHDSGEVWMLTGEPPVDGLGGSLRMERWRTGLTLLAPNTVCEMDGALLALTDRGVVAITPSGYRILSEPIARTISDAVVGAGVQVVRERAWAVVHPAERRYELSIALSSATKTAWAGFTYFAEADAWTGHSRPHQTGFWSTEEHRLWLAEGATAYREAAGYADDDREILYAVELPPFVAGDGATPKQLREVQLVFERGQPASVSVWITTENDTDVVEAAPQYTNVLRVMVPRELQRALRHQVRINFGSRFEWCLSQVVYLFQAYQERGTR